jgi:hypothetical protein
MIEFNEIQNRWNNLLDFEESCKLIKENSSIEQILKELLSSCLRKLDEDENVRMISGKNMLTRFVPLTPF